MDLLGTLIVGLIVGAIAKLVMPGRDPGGIIVTMLIGIAGAFVATYIGQALNWYGPGEGARWIASVLGAVVLLFLYRMFTGRRGTTVP